jgi:hypothetical protein
LKGETKDEPIGRYTSAANGYQATHSPPTRERIWPSSGQDHPDHSGGFRGVFDHRSNTTNLRSNPSRDGSVGDSIETIKWKSETVGNSMEKTVGNSMEKTVGNSIEKTVGNSIEKTVGNSIEKTVGNSIEKTVGNSPKKPWAIRPKNRGQFAQKTVGIFPENMVQMPETKEDTRKMPTIFSENCPRFFQENAHGFFDELPTEKTVGNSTEKSSENRGQTHGKIVGKSSQKTVGKSSVSGVVKPTDFFRYEIEYRSLKKGYSVLIRKRLKWSRFRYSRQVISALCPLLTPKHVSAARAGKFSAEAIQAFRQGGIPHEFIKIITKRNGKGAGVRRADLDAGIQLYLARFERMLARGTGARPAPATTDGGGIGGPDRFMPSTSGTSPETNENMHYVH